MSEPVLRILVVDDHTIVRKGLVSLLSTPRFGVHVVGEATDGFQAIELADKLKPDVIIMDLEMPGMGGAEATAEILRQNRNLRILMLTSFSGTDRVSDAVRAGARGYLLKDSSPDDLIYAIRGVARGQAVLPAEATITLLSGDDRPGETPIPGNPAEHLTTREVTILERLAKGMPNKEIAADLHISSHTVRSHVRTLFEKLNVSNRTQAAFYAMEHGLIPN